MDTNKTEKTFEERTPYEVEINENIKLYKTGGQPFASDTYFLAAFAKKGKLAAELGCGSGACSLICAAKGKFEKIVAYELQPSLFEAASENVEKNGLSDKIEVICSDVKDIKRSDSFDVVFANPPYLKMGGKISPVEEKALARHEISGGVSEFAACASRMLKTGGVFYCVYRPDRLPSLFAALKENKIEPKIMTFVHHKRDFPSSMVLVRAIKGGAESMSVTKPLIVNENNGSMTEDAQRIYDTCSFKDFLSER